MKHDYVDVITNVVKRIKYWNVCLCHGITIVVNFVLVYSIVI